MGLQRSMPCPKGQFWDRLLEKCMSCGLACHPPKFKGCADFCRSMDCSKRVGFYYDKLLRDCIDCSGVCGQHPKECDPSCQRAWPSPGTSRVAEQDAPAPTMPGPSALRGPPCQVLPICDPGMFVYIGLGLCLCTLLFVLLMWVHFRKRGEEAAGHKEGEHPKDCLMEEGSLRGGSSDSQTPEPIETCGFCFPEVSPAIQETKACSKACQTGAAVTGALPTPEDGHFPIICCPSQEKVPTA
uniref:TNFR-Cys domain-containing protein n=1 Tax=Anolis carolinensis TaxID=28377 RepID=H9G551_ANOCA|nr:PREDICTED: tumor necrosis factor receptor superfamily member 13B [Anolis carolinensis]|eukprot:XP_008117574.1 PREDICTED: tumor necrosis factor receptor superfamily member 13B [Anolis carolinensis]